MTTTSAGRRRLVLVLAIAAICLVVVEIGAFASLQLARQRAPERFVPDWDDYVGAIDQATIDRLNRDYFHPVLGWDYQPGFRSTRTNANGVEWTLSIDANGSRTNPLHPAIAPIQIATYGDSFTFCDDVADDETWQYYLSLATGANVANFGVGGYGPDQILLKYEIATWRSAPPRIVVLGIYDGDLNRAFFRYYPLYYPKSQQLLAFKPRFMLGQDGHLRLIESPKREPVRDQAHLRRLIDDAREHDDWYQRRVEVGFPYTLGALKLARLLREPAFGHLWASAEATALLDAIIDRFVATARSRGHVPAILFIPRVQSWENGRRAPPYQSFVERLRRKRPDLVTIDVAEATFEAARFNIRPFDGHASAYGNQIIATHVAAALWPLIAESARDRS